MMTELSDPDNHILFLDNDDRLYNPQNQKIIRDRKVQISYLNLRYLKNQTILHKLRNLSQNLGKSLGSREKAKSLREP